MLQGGFAVEFPKFSEFILYMSQVKSDVAKGRGAMEKPLRHPNGDLTRTPGEAFGVFLESPFSGARTKGDLKGL